MRVAGLSEGGVAPGVQATLLSVNVQDVAPAQFQVFYASIGGEEHNRRSYLNLSEAFAPEEHVISRFSLCRLHSLFLQAPLTYFLIVLILCLDNC